LPSANDPAEGKIGRQKSFLDRQPGAREVSGKPARDLSIVLLLSVCCLVRGKRRVLVTRLMLARSAMA
jgi:hypothetical protein